MGYVIDAEQHFQIDPVTAPYILDAFKQYDEGATMTQIRDSLNEQGMKNTRGNPLTYNSVQHLLKTAATLANISTGIFSFLMAYLLSYRKTFLTGYRSKWRKTRKPRLVTRLRTIIC